MRQIDFKELASLVTQLRQQNSQGMIICRKSHKVCELYFRQGSLIHASDNEGLQGDASLYALLNWPTNQTRLEWQAGEVGETQTIDEQEEAAWLEALQLLQERGFFNSAKKSEPEVNKVSPEMATAWESLQSQPIYNNLPATSANYHNLLKSFVTSRRNGIIRLGQDNVEYFCLLFRGQSLGLYRAESRPARLYHLQQIPALPDDLLNSPSAKLDVFLNAPQNSAYDKNALRPDEMNLIDDLFQSVIRLLSELTTPQRVGQNLAAIIQRGIINYPVLKVLAVGQSSAVELPCVKWDNRLFRYARRESLVGLDFVLKEVLEQYCNSIGPAIFHTMVARSISQTAARQLQQIGLQLDFLEDIAQSEATVQAQEADDSNPYDF